MFSARTCRCAFLLVLSSIAHLLYAQIHAVTSCSGVLPSGYTITDLGTLGGKTSSAWGINSLGHVTGNAFLSDNISSHAFLWTAAGGMQDLGVLGGNFSAGSAVNTVDEVVGYSETPTTFPEHVFSWTSSTGM